MTGRDEHSKQCSVLYVRSPNAVACSLKLESEENLNLSAVKDSFGIEKVDLISIRTHDRRSQLYICSLGNRAGLQAGLAWSESSSFVY